FTLAWKPGEAGQQALLRWFDEGDTRAYKIRFPNGTVDVFRGWVSSIGKAVTAKEVITRTIKVTNIGRPSLAEDSGTITPVTGITVTPATASVEAGKTVELTVAVQPDTASDKTFRVSSDHNNVATVTVKDNVITVKGVAKGTALIPVMSNGGAFAAVATVTVTTPAAQPAT
ncbi:Ig-like domain-containing protein, partial [Escherichia coli]